MFDINNIPSQKGRIAIITGSNTGLGFETALELAKKNTTVIMACRDLDKASKAKNAILSLAAGATVEVMELDLSKLSSVRAFADAYLKKYTTLDLLINNAGIMIPPFSKTEDGFESQMGANYFGHFLLTGLLLKTIMQTPHSRIVTLSSKAHERGRIDFENLHAEKSYSRMLAAHQSGTIAVSAHPGVSDTELGRYIPKLFYTVFMPVFSFFTHPPKDGALPTLMAALDEDVKGGDYFGPTGFNGMKGKPGKVKALPHAYDKEVAKKLWEVSEKLTGYTYTF